MSHSFALAEAILLQLSARGVELWVEAGALRFRAPRNAIDDEMRREIAENRDVLISILSQRGASPGDGRIQPRSPGQEPTLSFAQMRLWYLDQLEPGSPRYNIGSSLRFRGPVDLDVLAMAVDDLFMRHEAFRTCIRAADGKPVLEILPRPLIALDVVDLSSDPPADVEAAVKYCGREALCTSFDLASGRLALMRAVRFAPDNHLIVFVAHHIISDGWSLDLVWRDLHALVEARATSRPSRLAPLPLQYSDFATWEQTKAQTKGFAEDVAYWRETLAGAPNVLQLPFDRPRRLTGSTRGSRYNGHIKAAVIDRLRDVARERGATLFMGLIAVWQTLLSRLSGQDEVVVGTPVATRDDEHLKDVIGCFINNIALRGDLSGSPTFTELLERTKRMTLGAFRHDSLPFDMVVEAVNPPRTLSYAPVFQTLFTLLNFHTGGSTSSQVDSAPIDADAGTTRFDLSLELSFVDNGAHAGDLLAAYEFDSDIFDEATIARLHVQFLRLLESACENPLESLHKAPLNSPEERRALVAMCQSEMTHVDPTPFPQQFERQVQSAPDRCAVSVEGSQLTYDGLNRRANRIARFLMSRGAQEGCWVGVCLKRDFDLVATLIAIQKCGAAYLPLDPKHPHERRAFMLEDSGCKLLVVDATTESECHASPDVQLVNIEADAATIASLDDGDPPVLLSAGAPVYLIYTSGSTGKPKGVVVSHGNLANFLGSMRREPGLSPDDVLAAVTTVSFDIAGLELYLPLLVGARIELIDSETAADGELLMARLARSCATTMQATPTTWRQLIDAGWRGGRGFRVLCGGEGLPRDLADELLDRTEALWNMYGPTETTVWSSLERVQPGTDPVNIGRPIANTEIYILDGVGEPTPLGVPGEIFIGGMGVAIGYHNRPDITAQRFVPDHISRRSDARLYATGDLGMCRADGRFYHLGRRDTQIKIRGMRIELGEIETALRTMPEIQAAIAVSSEPTPGDGRLVAYVVYHSGQDLSVSEVRRYLRRSLPDYMVPSVVVAIDTVPLTPNGKIDRAALPDPFKTSGRTRNYEPPAPGIEQEMAEIWREFLSVDSIGADDNFFELGGQSLLSLRVAAAVERRIGRQLDPRSLFFQTLRQVAANVANGPLSTRPSGS
jgi:amino acid adenylation domain-containing protein